MRKAETQESPNSDTWLPDFCLPDSQSIPAKVRRPIGICSKTEIRERTRWYPLPARPGDILDPNDRIRNEQEMLRKLQAGPCLNQIDPRRNENAK